MKFVGKLVIAIVAFYGWQEWRWRKISGLGGLK